MLIEISLQCIPVLRILVRSRVRRYLVFNINLCSWRAVLTSKRKSVSSRMSGIGLFLFAVFAFAAFASVFVATCQLTGYVSSQTVPPTVTARELYKDRDQDAFLWALLVDFVLLVLFMGQHSLMASSWWKERLHTAGLLVAERSIFIMATALSLQALMTNWYPLPATPLWLIDTSDRPFLWMFFFILHLFCWIIIYASTLTMDMAELVGLKQLYYRVQSWDHPLLYKSRPAQKLYRHMRHPGVGCFVTLLWVHPVMTLGRFLLAVTWTLYLLFAFSVRPQDYVYVEQQVVRKRVQITRSFEVVE